MQQRRFINVANQILGLCDGTGPTEKACDTIGVRQDPPIFRYVLKPDQDAGAKLRPSTKNLTKMYCAAPKYRQRQRGKPAGRGLRRQIY